MSRFSEGVCASMKHTLFAQSTAGKNYISTKRKQNSSIVFAAASNWKPSANGSGMRSEWQRLNEAAA